MENSADSQVNNSSENNTDLSQEQQRLINLCAREKVLEMREKNFELNQLKKYSYDILKEKGFKEDYHEMLSEFINYENEESCNQSIERVTVLINKITEPLVNDRLRSSNIPSTNMQVKGNVKKVNTTFSDAVKSLKNKIFN